MNIMRIIFRLSIIFIISNMTSNVFANDKSYKQAFEYIKKSNWSKAQDIAKELHDTALLKIILSQKFLDINYKSTTFAEITSFLKKNPKWPQNQALKCRAEGLINDRTDKILIFNWFTNNLPKTGAGYKYYALAAAQIIKDPDILATVIKNGWIYGNFSKEEEIIYYKRFKKFLTPADNVNRIDNLLWKGSLKAARSSLHLVSSGYKKAFEVQMAFLELKKDAKKLFKKVPKEYYTSGLVYQYINSQKSDLPSVKEITGLIKQINHTKGHEGDFWKVQNYLAREYIENRRFNDAYVIASNHFATSAVNVSEAEFLSGWLALRFLNKPKLAIKHFEKFSKVVKSPMSISRGLYWLARAYEESGNPVEAEKHYKHAAHQFGYTFYGQVATMDLGENKLRLPPKVTLANHGNEPYIKNNDILKATKLVSKYGNNALARSYLDGLVDSCSKDQEILAIALQMQHSKLHHRVWMSKSAIQKHVFIDHLSYPAPYKVKQLPTEEALTYGIIRQESVFDQFAISTASAMGLMQLIKPTACETAKKISIKCDIRDLTKDPYYNVTLGSHHLAKTIKNYENSYVLAIAAYNAGPGNINKWLKLYGDPRNFKNPHKVIDWIETIPFAETRNYVQRVLENVQIYRSLLSREGKFKLRQDLMGG